MYLPSNHHLDSFNCFSNVTVPWSITLEEHFTSKAALPYEAAKYTPLDQYVEGLLPQLGDLYDGRINDMDKNGIAIQVVSHSPFANLSNQNVMASNDELAKAIRKNPDRLAGFALLPMSDPAAAVAELKRCVKDLGFVGALVDNHDNGNFYDSNEYETFWSTVEALDVPIYLHPTFPSEAMKDALYSGGGLDSQPAAAMVIGTFGFGWHSSTATSLLRLLGSKVFDNHRNLKIIIGHTGELLPIMFERIDRISHFYGVDRTFSDIMHTNVWITTSGMFDIPSLRNVLSWMPLERVLFSVDYPYSDNELGREYLNNIQQANALDKNQLQNFACENARRLLSNRRRT